MDPSNCSPTLMSQALLSSSLIRQCDSLNMLLGCRDFANPLLLGHSSFLSMHGFSRLPSPRDFEARRLRAMNPIHGLIRMPPPPFSPCRRMLTTSRMTSVGTTSEKNVRTAKAVHPCSNYQTRSIISGSERNERGFSAATRRANFGKSDGTGSHVNNGSPTPSILLLSPRIFACSLLWQLLVKNERE